ncbi:MAG: hypothetical protein J3Q66DRAFT_325919 [Benniella sp.]|nr:MAG: hypothetical protein J3Q66DRAFT_325919 [Benniella sp.]
MLTMPGPVSVFDIPLLLDTICAMLDPQDIGNCAMCSKEWYSSFGPYRFQSVNITSSHQDKNTFLLNNSHHIRDLTIDLCYFETFVDPNCNRLQNLTLGFSYEKNEESDRDDGKLDEMELDELEYTKLDKADPEILDPSLPKIYNPACAAKLIQECPSLRVLCLSNAYGSETRRAVPITRPILEAINNHAFLTKIEVTFSMKCRMFSILLNHLPQQLQELDVSQYTENVRNHRLCNRQIRLLSSHTSTLGLRCLSLKQYPKCFSNEALICLLKRCPELEVLRLPIPWDTRENIARMVQALDSNCPRLHTLDQEDTFTMEQIGVLLTGFSKGFRQLHLIGVYSGDDPEWQDRQFLETLLSSASVNTVEVLKCQWSYDNEEHVISTLKHCKQLREFRVYLQGFTRVVDLSDLLLSMDDWACYSTLEELELRIDNKRAVREHSDAESRRQRTAQDVRELCLRLRSFPKLKTLDIYWKLKNTWDPESYDEESYYQESYDKSHEITLTLDDLNEGALKSGSATMTKEDGAWAGLKLD